MDTVPESAMAAAMASLGAIAIIHSSISPATQAAVIHSVKSRRVPILSHSVFLPPSAYIDSPDDFADSPFILVMESGNSKSKLLGYVSKEYYMNQSYKSLKVRDYMAPSTPLRCPGAMT
ncbi:hypothetical protein Ahy_B06g081769 [Arachis hypogaea]|uniref:IMP dehydrogenase/GMP reductase domain-containing protein n=1 Tax=Arachis hypogaea TaxID=3818 RepID=A0A444YLZ7_ARAHY|nr:hypothetical protein Ahy_B06g081769 [Arachis hypogaea]